MPLHLEIGQHQSWNIRTDMWFMWLDKKRSNLSRIDIHRFEKYTYELFLTMMMMMASGGDIDFKNIVSCSHPLSTINIVFIGKLHVNIQLASIQSFSMSMHKCNVAKGKYASFEWILCVWTLKRSCWLCVISNWRWQDDAQIKVNQCSQYYNIIWTIEIVINGSCINV